MKIEIISGSPRENSLTVRIALLLQQWLVKHSTHEVGIIDCRDHALPWVQEVFRSVDTTPQEFKVLATRMFEADAFILVSPEYNGSYSPSLKNLLDHFPKQLHKPIGIATGTNGALGGIRAAHQLYLLSAGLFGIASPTFLLVPQTDKKIDEGGNLIDDKFESSIKTFIAEYLWLAEKIVSK